MQKRLKNVAYQNQYDYCIINDILEHAVSDFQMIVRAEELRTQSENL